MGNSSSFSLSDYDAASLIVEITGSCYTEAEAIKPYDRSLYKKEVEAAKAEGRPVPPPPPMGNIRFTVKLEAVFKGSVKGDSLTLTTASSGSACGWQPREGKRYILYLYERKGENEEKVVGVSSCSRIIWSDGSQYASEKRILKDLATISNGEIVGEQNELLRLPGENTDGEYNAFSGAIKNGKRQGIWLVYPPIFGREDSLAYKQPALIVAYQEGRVIDYKQLLGSEDWYLRWWLRTFAAQFYPSKE
jgi:hypothetical protein